MTKLYISLLLILSLFVTGAAQLAKPIERVLSAGNSITFNEPSPGEPYYWLGRWGENASAAHKDYVHQTWAGITARQNSVPDMRIFSAIFTAQVEQIPDQIREYRPDVVIVQWGEAGGTGVPQEAWNALYVPIGQAAREVNARAIAVGMWGTREIGDRDEKLRNAAIAASMIYVHIADLHAPRTPEMCAGLHPGVCEHPNDLEMALIAERILAAIYPDPNAALYLPFVSNGAGTISPAP